MKECLNVERVGNGERVQDEYIIIYVTWIIEEDDKTLLDNFFDEAYYLNQTVEDTAINFLDLAKSYKLRGLYSQSAENFSKALSLESSSLGFDYYYNLFCSDFLKEFYQKKGPQFLVNLKSMRDKGDIIWWRKY